jgi:hypothetical protein
MSIVRDIGYTLQALDVTSVVTCSTANQTLASTANVVQSSAAFAVGVNGRIIDRLSEPFLTQRFTVAMPSAKLRASRGSTETDRYLSLGIKLQHGASSGGGDMADYSTGSQPADAVFFTTAQTTPMYSWSTGGIYAQTKPAYYDLRGANRYIRAVVFPKKDKVTTESSGDEGMTVTADICFLGADSLPINAWTSAGSTTTSTTT